MASALISAKLPSRQLAPHHVLVRVRFAPKAEIGHSRPAHLSLDTFCKGRPLRLPGGNTHSVGNPPSIFAGNKKNRQDEARRYAVQHILRGACRFHTTKSACEARPKPSEAILGGVVWLHLGGKGQTAEKQAPDPPTRGKIGQAAEKRRKTRQKTKDYSVSRSSKSRRRCSRLAEETRMRTGSPRR